MAEAKKIRLRSAAKKLNVGISTITKTLKSKGFEVESNPNAVLTSEQYDVLVKEFESSMEVRREASSLTIGKTQENIVISSEVKPEPVEQKELPSSPSPAEKEEAAPVKEEKVIEQAKKQEEAAPVKEEKTEEPIKAQLPGLKVIDKIDLDNLGKSKTPKKPAKSPVAKKKVENREKSEDRKKRRQDRRSKLEETKPEAKVEKPAAPDEKKEAPAVEPEKPEVKKPTVSAQAKEKSKPKAKTVEKKVTETPEGNEKSEPAAVVAPDVSGETAEDGKVIQAKADKLQGLTVLGKIELPSESRKKGKPAGGDDKKRSKRKRKRIKTQKPATTGGTAKTSGGAAAQKPGGSGQSGGKSGGNANPAGPGRRSRRTDNKKKRVEKPAAATDKEIQDQIKDTLARLSGRSAGRSARRGGNRKDKRVRTPEAEGEVKKTLQVTEFISANDLAVLLETSINELVSKCFQMGMIIGINQRLDAEQIDFIADEFGYDVEFISAEQETEIVLDEEDVDESLLPRAPIVTIMGHVDHGKTSLLDYIRDTKVTEGEAGGITQHIGAYNVKTESGKQITFLDTPGHEAFTAMRARGAKVTDVVIIVIAADDSIMPQTKEAINHAQLAGVPIVFAFNKMDKPEANPERLKEKLSEMNILVEDWGGKVQSQEISAKTGRGVDELLEKVLLESEILDLKANPNKRAQGTVIEAFLDKGRGYVSTILVQAGELNIGDVILAGRHFGRVKAMFDHRGKKMGQVGPAVPVQVLGLAGAPQAGDKFNGLESETEARKVAARRDRIFREQSRRTTVRPTLGDIGRRIALGNFKTLNIVLKGDVDGSVEALSDSLLHLSTEEIEVRIIHKAVGQISESDVLLAAASDAIIVGFQVRPSVNARRLAEQENVETRLYSVIYDAINEVRTAMEGMLAPDVEEVILGNAEVRNVFKISRIGTVAGCYVTDGIIKRNAKIRLIRDGIVIYGGNDQNGEINALKRFKEDVNEVRTGFECGLSIKNFNDIKVGDVIEGYEQKEVARRLMK